MTSKDSRMDSGRADSDYQAVVNISAAPDSVYQALATIPGVSGWWSDATGEASTGGELVVRFGDRRKFIHVDEAVHPALVRWTVRKSEPSPEWKETRIMFDLTPDGAGHTQLRLRHRGLTPDLECFGECSAAWPIVLGSLANYVETGQGQPFTTASNGDSTNG